MSNEITSSRLLKLHQVFYRQLNKLVTELDFKNILRALKDFPPTQIPALEKIVSEYLRNFMNISKYNFEKFLADNQIPAYLERLEDASIENDLLDSINLKPDERAILTQIFAGGEFSFPQLVSQLEEFKKQSAEDIAWLREVNQQLERNRQELYKEIYELRRAVVDRMSSV